MKIEDRRSVGSVKWCRENGAFLNIELSGGANE